MTWKLLARVVIATFLLLLWGMLFWGLLYHPVEVHRDLDADTGEALARVLVDSSLDSGAYFFPWPRTPEHAETWLAKHTSGPFFELHFSREGVNPQTPGKFLAGTLQYALVVILALALLRCAGPLPSKRRFLLVFIAGVIGTVFIQISRPVWFHLPWHYSLAHAAFELGSWVVLAAVLAPPTASQR